MRKVFLFMNVSLDGYVSTLDGDLSWAHRDFAAFSQGESGEVDTILLGRKTYDMMKSFWPTQQAMQALPEVARFMNERVKVVASRSAFDPGWRNVTLIQDAVTDVRRIKGEPGENIIILGSNNLCASLAAEGLIDEIQLLVNPVLLGAGVSLFAGLAHPVGLTLAQTRPFSAGRVMLVYTPGELSAA